MGQTLKIQGLSFSYPGTSEFSLHNLELDLPRGWTALSGANGSGKSTFLKLLAGDLHPDSGHLDLPGPVLYVAQNLEYPAYLDDFYADLSLKDAWAGKLFSALRLEWTWPYTWENLSYGEQKRAQLAAALYKNPAVLALDEPSNHLDETAKALILETLRAYEGFGLLVSHDRLFLNELCSQTILLENGRGRYFKGNWAQSQEQKRQEALRDEHRYETALKEKERLNRELLRRRQDAAKHQKDFSKKNLDAKDFDAKSRIDALRVSSKDAVGARLSKIQEDRLDRFIQNMPQKPRDQKLGARLESRGFTSDYFFFLESQVLALGTERKLFVPALSLKPGERRALLGPNGSGKTTLIRQVLASCKLAPQDYAYLAQDLDTQAAESYWEGLNALSDLERGQVLAYYSRLNGRPEVLVSDQNHGLNLSPGELKKLALAFAFFRQVPLLILDEPTNHLDLPSLEALETALLHYDGALLCVSHDEAFRKNLNLETWTLRIEGQDSFMDLA